MRRFLAPAMAMAAAFLINPPGLVFGDDQAAKAILDKGIKALGGEDQLAKVHAATWKGKGKFSVGGNESEFKLDVTIEGIDHFRSEFEGDFGGNTVKGVTVLNKDKAWRKFGDNFNEMDEKQLAAEKRNVYLQLAPITLVVLKDKDFKIETAGEEKVADKPALGLKVTGPDSKTFTIYFDKESGLPVLQKAQVFGFRQEEFEQETTFTDYKDFGGIKKATKIESSRGGEKFLDVQVSDFKVLDKVPAEKFAEPMN